MRRGTLKLDTLRALVLDEADEMLRMGFIDDVEWILEQTPAQRQVALFSATMPQQIRRIAVKHLKDPAEITIKVKTTTAETIRQRYWPVSGLHKLDALTRILEAEPFDAMLVFVRTKTATVELAERLEARGYAAIALNGDIPQQQRERTVENLKNGKLDILVATDVAARGLDVKRISHVINYDIPYDTEAYVHRIGRTGRAGRTGDAILFVAPREQRMLGVIEKATRSKIELMELPSTELINDQRVARFKQRITDTLANEDVGLFAQLVEQYQQEHNVPALEIAAALARLLQGDTPLLLQHKPARAAQSGKTGKRTGGKPPADEVNHAHERGERPPRRQRTTEAAAERSPASELERFRIEVGRQHGVKPANIVGAIANEAGIDSRYMGRITINEDHSLIDLPKGMPKDVFSHLKKVRVAGQQLRISRPGAEPHPDFPVAKRGKPAGQGKAGKKPGFRSKGAQRKKAGKRKPAR
jgi:ATP-dependent RNA helicase DeaD